MKLKTVIFISIPTILLLLLLLSSCSSKSKNAEVNQLDLKSYFENYNGSFILYDEDKNKYSIYNEKQVDERFSPCSTFKIVNSLIGLETGVITGKDYTYKWDGENYPIESWNKDQTLETAMTNSVTWYFQRLAQNVGEKSMNEYMDKLDYGNNDTSGGLTNFWLASTLKISAREQIHFLKKIYHNELPFSKENMQIVRDIITLESNDEYTLFGKTGTGGDRLALGWFIGALKKDNRMYYFATNILGEESNGPKAKEITISILKHLDVYK